MRTFTAKVAVVSPKAEAQGESACFMHALQCRTRWRNATGMEARGKISSDGALPDTVVSQAAHLALFPESGIGLAVEDEGHEGIETNWFLLFWQPRRLGM